TTPVTCPACGRPNPPKQKFCNGCGQALARPADRAAPPEHRSAAGRSVSEPIRVYELEGMGALHTPLEVSRARGFSRFVGRQDEMTAREAALARAIAGSAQVVGIVGEPGVGKSRLCFEFLERCRARGLAIYEAHGVPHGKALPLLPVARALPQLLRYHRP